MKVFEMLLLFTFLSLLVGTVKGQKKKNCHVNGHDIQDGGYFVSGHLVFICLNGKLERSIDSMDCPTESFQCESGNQCLPLSTVCNGRTECKDASEERFCGN